MPSPNDVTSDGSRTESESTCPNVRTISKKKNNFSESGNRIFQRPTLAPISIDLGNIQSQQARILRKIHLLVDSDSLIVFQRSENKVSSNFQGDVTNHQQTVAISGRPSWKSRWRICQLSKQKSHYFRAECKEIHKVSRILDIVLFGVELDDGDVREVFSESGRIC